MGTIKLGKIMKIASLIFTVYFMVGCTTISKFSLTSKRVDSNDLSQVMTVAGNDVKSCIDKAFKYRKAKYGTLVLNWDITDEGRAVNVTVEDSLDGIFDTCMIGVVSNIEYIPPKSKKIKRVNFPFHYTRGKFYVVAKNNNEIDANDMTIGEIAAEIYKDNKLPNTNNQGDNLEDEVYSDLE